MPARPQGTRGDDVSLVHDILRECGLGWTPGAVTPMRRGRASEAWRFEVHGQAFLLRVPSRRTRPEHFAAHLTAHALCAAAGVAVPPVVAAVPASAVAGGPCMVLGWVGGHDLDTLLGGARGPAARAAVRQAGAALGRLHAVPGAGFDRFLLGDGTGGSWEAVCRWRLDDVLGDAGVRKLLGDTRLAAADRIVARLGAVLPAGIAPRLTHGDCHYPNMVVGGDGDVTLIDLEHARLYDPLWDFCKLDAWSLRARPETTEDFLEGYRSAGHDDPRAQPRLRVYQLVEYLHGLRYFALRYPDPAMERSTMELLDRLLAGEEGLIGARLGSARAGGGDAPRAARRGATHAGR